MKTKLTFFAFFSLLMLSCNATKVNIQDKITERTWKLKSLNGKDVEINTNQEKDIYFVLKSEDNRMNGFSGCNNFFGAYSLQDGNQITFSSIGATKMACFDVKVNESDLFEVFNTADNYSINGNELSLNKGKRAPLAIFVSVEKN